MNIKIGASILILIIWMSHLPCYAMPIDQNQIRIHKQNFTDITCNAASHHCVSIGMTPEEENAKYLIYLSDNDGDTWDQSIQLTRPKISQEPYMFPLVSLSCDAEADSCIAAGLKRYPEDEDKSDAIAYITYDSGYNWQPLLIQPSEKNSLFTKVFCDNASAICHIVGFDEKYF